MKERIAQIMEHEGLTAVQFAQLIGISASSLSHILNGRNNPSLDVVMKIHQTFDYVDLNWLLYGQGELVQPPHPHSVTGDFPVSGAHEVSLFTDPDTESRKNREEIAFENIDNAPQTIIREEVKYIEKPARKIVEIRIFFDNGTFEIFKPTD